jgi:L-threonylcarbamoyladenylate synthase
VFTTRVIPVHPDRPDPAAIEQAARVLRDGGLVAFATETVYGLGADATNPAAVARIFEAKGRPPSNPLIVHLADKSDALDCVSTWPDRASRLADRYWPGPLTMVLPRSSIIPDIVTAGQDTVGVRVPSAGVARWLILEAGRPIAAPSANRSTGISPTLAKHVIQDLGTRVDLILDSGPTTIGIESTVLDLSGDRPRVLRPGEITREELSEFLGDFVGGPGDRLKTGDAARSPGQMAIHYAPRTPTFRMERDQIPMARIEGRFCTMIVGERPDNGVPQPRMPHPRIEVSPPLLYRLADPQGASRNLYAWLHELDGLGLDFILIIPPPDEPRWSAVRDRIWRASRPWPQG